jgi:hypothetical protein
LKTRGDLTARESLQACEPCTDSELESGMRTERVEVRLDPETREKLEEMAAARGSSVSELVRAVIEHSYEEEVAGAARLVAAERIGRMEVEDVPEPAELKRQLSETHGQERAP